MSRAKPAIFVQQRTYKRRRMADAARVLPILGVVLFMIPLLWTSNTNTQTSSVMVYVFVVWASLAAIAGFLSRRLAPEDDEAEDGDTG